MYHLKQVDHEYLVPLYELEKIKGKNSIDAIVVSDAVSELGNIEEKNCIDIDKGVLDAIVVSDAVSELGDMEEKNSMDVSFDVEKEVLLTDAVCQHTSITHFNCSMKRIVIERELIFNEGGVLNKFLSQISDDENISLMSCSVSLRMFGRVYQKLSFKHDMNMIGWVCLAISTQLHQKNFYTLKDAIARHGKMDESQLMRNLKRAKHTLFDVCKELEYVFIGFAGTETIEEKRYKIKDEVIRIPFEDIRHIKHTKRIGEGSFGKVMEAVLTTEKGQVVVAEKRTAYDLEIGYQHFIREVCILNILRDVPNVPRLIAIKLGTIYMTLGRYSLISVISESKGNNYCHLYDYDDILKWMTDLLNILKVCHNRNIAHRDLKPGNIVITDDRSLLLIDWGAATLNASCSDDLNTYVTTRWYRSPEMFNEDGTHQLSNDVWSAGCIFGELCIRKTIFPVGKNTPYNGWSERIYKTLKKLKLKMNLEYFEILTQMLKLDPKTRISAASCLEMFSKIKLKK
jgi:hypothetical protein